MKRGAVPFVVLFVSLAGSGCVDGVGPGAGCVRTTVYNAVVQGTVATAADGGIGVYFDGVQDPTNGAPALAVARERRAPTQPECAQLCPTLLRSSQTVYSPYAATTCSVLVPRAWDADAGGVPGSDGGTATAIVVECVGTWNPAACTNYGAR